MISTPFPSSGFPNWIEKFLYRAFLVVVQPAIPSDPAMSTVTKTPVSIGILRRKFMVAQAMRLGSLHVRMGLYCNHIMQPGVKSLLFPRSPSAVFWSVVAVIIDSINRVLFGTGPHVQKKVLESRTFWNYAAPSLANGYTSASIVFVIRPATVLASLNHVGPSVVHGLQRLIAHLIPPIKCIHCSTVKVGNTNAI